MKFLKWVSIAAALVLTLLIISCWLIPGDVLPRAKWAYAGMAAAHLKLAISAYQAEYGEFPLVDPANDISFDSGNVLMDILLGSDTQKEPGGRNPRGIAFYTDKAASPMGDGRFRKGVTLDENGGSELWDPWGNHYHVRLDTNGDGKTENPEAPGMHLLESILVWSAGPDGDFETWKDNVKSWMPRDTER